MVARNPANVAPTGHKQITINIKAVIRPLISAVGTRIWTVAVANAKKAPIPANIIIRTGIAKINVVLWENMAEPTMPIDRVMNSTLPLCLVSPTVAINKLPNVPPKPRDEMMRPRPHAFTLKTSEANEGISP